MPQLLVDPTVRTWWAKRRNRCLQCGHAVQDFHLRRWCSEECEEYWVQDTV
jgi:hypothetical protein